MGLEFRKADDDVGFQHDPGETHSGHEMRVEINLLGVVSNILIITLGCFHQACLPETRLICPIAHDPWIVADNDRGGLQGLNFFHDGAKHGWMRNDALPCLRSPKDVWFYQYSLPSKIQRKKIKGPVNGLA